MLRLGTYSSFLIGNMTKHLKAPPPLLLLPLKAHLNCMGSLPSVAGQTNSAFVTFEGIAGGLEVKCL